MTISGTDPLPAVPRRVRQRPGRGHWANRLIALVYLMIGLAGAAFVGFLLLWRWFGMDLPATITGTHVSYGSKGRVHYRLDYQYDWQSQSHSTSDQVDFDVYEHYRPENGATAATARYFALGRFHYVELRESGTFWGRHWILIFMAGVWNGLTLVVVYRAWIKPLRVRQLFQRGEAASGVVVRKWEETAKNSHYYVAYRFTQPATGESFENKIELEDADEWEPVREGQPVTVLFFPEHPRFNTGRAGGDFEVMDP